MTSPTFPELPAGLRARLDAAGVTDAATLAAALDADPRCGASTRHSCSTRCRQSPMKSSCAPSGR
jgi:hypothetical protein